MNGFDCKITNPGNKVLAQPQVPVECNGGDCILGGKLPFYWANRGHQNVKFSGEYERKPAYNDKWGFKDGAQDIFQAGAEQPPALPAPESGPNTPGQPDQPPKPTGPPQVPEGCPVPVTVTVTVPAATVTVAKRMRQTAPRKW